jgi:hypothetical protein
MGRRYSTRRGKSPAELMLETSVTAAWHLPRFAVVLGLILLGIGYYLSPYGFFGTAPVDHTLAIDQRGMELIWRIIGGCLWWLGCLTLVIAVPRAIWVSVVGDRRPGF